MKNISRILQIFTIFACISILFASCEKAPKMPKPPTYLRLDIAPSKYVEFKKDGIPFSFKYPQDGKIVQMDSKSKNSLWFNIAFEEYNFDINVSCLFLTADTMLQYAVNDSYRFLSTHEKLSSGIVQQEYKNLERKVYGTTFEIQGRDVISPYQFYLTDSTKYFVRCALYNRAIPNNDSIAPIIDRLKKDMQTMISSFTWKKYLRF